MCEWKECKLGEITSKIGSGATPKGGKNSYRPEGISLIRSQNVYDFYFSNNGLAFVDNNQAYELRNVEVFENDILLNITGESVTRCCVVPTQYLPARVNQHVSIIRPIKEKVDYRFVFYALQSIKPELNTMAEIGCTRRALTKGMLENLDISLPPLPEQRAIASVLSSLDDKIDLLHRQNKTLEAMAETLFRQWFVEEADEGWERVKLGQFIEVMRGLSYKGAGLAEKGNGVPMHNLNSVYEGGGYKHEGIKYYSGDYRERHLVKPGDVIITNTEQGHDLLLIGYPAIVPKYFGDFGIFSQHIYRLRLKDKRITELFLYYLLMSYGVREQLAGATNGSTVNMLPKDGIEWAKFKIPPDGKIKEFTSVVKPLLGKKESNYSQIRTLEKLRDTMLSKLMSGEVRVSY